MKKIARLMQVMAAAVAMAVMAFAATAADKVFLKNGKVIEGTIIREVEGAIWIETMVGGVKTEEMYGPSDISKVERDAASTPAPSVPVSESKPKAAPAAKGSVPKAAVISLGDNENGHMVGVFLTADILKRAIPLLEQELGTDKTGIVVLRVHSGGGLGLEVPKINAVIQREYKTRWRTVAWIESAISAAAMASHGIEETYFTSQGNYGGCVGFYGSFDRPVEGYELEKALAQMEGISKDGKRDPLIMRAMQLIMPLSATVMPTGEVKFYPDATSGDIVVNREGEVLTFNAQAALKCKFSSGTADNLEQLTKALGYQELTWVGEKVRNIPYPVSKAEKLQIDFRKRTKQDQDGLNSYYGTFQREVAAAASEQDATRRGAFINRADQALKRIKDMIRNNPNFKITIFNTPEQYDEFIKEADKTIADLKKIK
jgi:hypothetical protein